MDWAFLVVCGVALSWLVRDFALEAFEVGALDSGGFEPLFGTFVAELLVRIRWVGPSTVSAADVAVNVLGAVFIASVALVDNDLVFEDPGAILFVH